MTIWEYIIIGVGFYLAFRMGQASILMLLKDEVRQRIMQGQTPVSAVKDLVGAVEEDKEECVFGVERHQGQYYAFAESGEFLAQGPDFREMFAVIKKRFPNRSFRVNRSQEDLTAEESQQMVDAIFETFGERNERKNS